MKKKLEKSEIGKSKCQLIIDQQSGDSVTQQKLCLMSVSEYRCVSRVLHLSMASNKQGIFYFYSFEASMVSNKQSVIDHYEAITVSLMDLSNVCAGTA